MICHVFPFRNLIRPNNSFLTDSTSSDKEVPLMSFNLAASKSCVSISDREPKATYRNCRNSLSEFRAAPSAILLGTEMAARLICEVSPNCSSFGSSLVKRYIFSANSIALFQTSRSLCVFIVFLLITHHSLPITHYSSRSLLLLLNQGIPNKLPFP